MVLAGGESGYLQIWDLINVQEVCRITAHEGKTLHRPSMNSERKTVSEKWGESKVREGKNSFTFLHQASLSFFCPPFFALYHNRPRSIYQYSNMAPRLSGQTPIFGVVFLVSKSLLGIDHFRYIKILTWL